MSKIGKLALLLAMVCVLTTNHYIALAAIPEVVLDASDAINITGKIRVIDDEGGSIGKVLEINGAQSDAGPVANPTDYAEMEFAADAGAKYYIWTRGECISDSNVTDAFWGQFDDLIGTNKLGDTYNHIKGLGNWLDRFPKNTYAWSSALPQDPPQTITFDKSGKHKLRIQPRHVVHHVDQIWLSTTQQVLPNFFDPVKKPSGQGMKAVEYSGKLAATWGEIKVIQRDQR